jgi:hypothetical protein
VRLAAALLGHFGGFRSPRDAAGDFAAVDFLEENVACRERVFGEDEVEFLRVNFAVEVVQRGDTEAGFLREVADEELRLR